MTQHLGREDARDDDYLARPRTIEVVEQGEEAVVSKTAHAKEEIAIHKSVENRTETVRSSEVED